MMTADVISQNIEIAAERHIYENRKSPEFVEKHNLADTTYMLPTWVPREYLDWDPSRTARFGLSGLLLNGPCGYFWLRNLERTFGTGHSFQIVIKKVCSDAFIYTPFISGCFFSFQGILEGKGALELYEKLETKWINSMQVSWRFWPVVNLFSFTFLPFQFRMLFNNFMSMGWNTFLSGLNNSKAVDAVVNHELSGTSCNCLQCRSIMF
jgi:protein Mpv17